MGSMQIDDATGTVTTRTGASGMQAAVSVCQGSEYAEGEVLPGGEQLVLAKVRRCFAGAADKMHN